MHCDLCLRDKQCDVPAAYCGLCKGELYREDMLYAWEGRYICGICIEDKFNAMSTREKAELLGAYPVRVEYVLAGQKCGVPPGRKKECI